MTWTVVYHHEVGDDLLSLVPAMARRVVRAIDVKLAQSPLDFGSPLSGGLSGFRKLRVGDCRVVYKTVEFEVMVYVLAVGPGRDAEIYRSALKRKR